MMLMCLVISFRSHIRTVGWSVCNIDLDNNKSVIYNFAYYSTKLTLNSQLLLGLYFVLVPHDHM